VTVIIQLVVVLTEEFIVFIYLHRVNVSQTLGDCNVKHISHCMKENVVTNILCKVSD
jgi:hypothetical protein